MEDFKKTLRILLIGILLVSGSTAQAQTFSQTSPDETIDVENDTIYWDITVPTPNGGEWGNVSVTVYYQGDFGGSTEYMTVYGENYTELGTTRAYYNGSDCQEDSVTLTFPTSMLSSWGADNVIHFYGITQYDVGVWCPSTRAQIKVQYNYCPLGGPVAVLQPLATNSFCTPDPGVSLSGTPSGGTYAGDGVSGSSFDPSGLSSGNHVITYTYQNPAGCTSIDEETVDIKEGATATADDYNVTPNQTVNMQAGSNGHMEWFSDQAITDSIAYGSNYTTNVLTTTTYYAATALWDNYFTLESLTPNNPVLVEIEGVAGDDRGGIAVTHDYVYMAGDSYTARFDLDLQGGVSLPVRDAMFSDLGTGQLWTLYSSSDGMPIADNSTFIQIDEIRTLNDDLSLGSVTIPLSQPIIFGHSYSSFSSGLFAGNGIVIIHSAVDGRWTVIDLQDGVVTDLGYQDPSVTEAAYAENWAYWGVAEYTQNGYAVTFRQQYTNDIVRRVLPDQPLTVVASFSDLNDMANFTYAPWNNRWYLHFEFGSQFVSPYAEILMYADATDTTGTMTYAGTLGCPAEVRITVISPLPSELGDFTTTRIENTVRCDWETASERALDFFTIERRTNGTAFLPIGTIKAAGNSEQLLSYSFTDENPGMGLNYYRLKIVDTDGTVKYSDIASHKFTSGSAISIYPNPTSSMATVASNDGFDEIVVTNAQGQLMSRFDEPSITTKQELDLQHYPDGLYIVRITKGGTTEIRKLMKTGKSAH